MILNKRVCRGIKHNLSFYIVGSILTLLSSALLIAGLSTGSTLESAVSEFLEKYSAEDAEFTLYNKLTDEDIKTIEDKYNVVIEENNYKHVDGVDESNLRVFNQTFKVNKYCVNEGNDIASDDDVLITQRYAEEHNIKIGDKIDINGTELTVCGYAIKSDYIYMLEKLSDAYRDNKKFGIAIVSDDTFKKIDSLDTNYYGIIYNEDNNIDVRKYLNDKFMIMSYMNRGVNTRISLPLTQGRDVNSMAQMAAPLFFIIVIIVVALVISKIIKNESDVIGTLLALGYKKNKIIGFYSSYGLIPGIVGGILGSVIGVMLTGPFASFFIEVDFEPFKYEFTYSMVGVLSALILPVLLYCISSVAVAAVMLKKNVIDLIHNATGDEKTVGILKNSKLKIKSKLQIREVIGHPQKSIVLIIGVLVSTALLTIGMNSYNAFNNVVKTGVADSSKYNYMYVMNSLNKENNFGGEGILMHSYEVDGNTVQISAIGLNDDTEYFENKTVDGQKMDMDKWYISTAASSTFAVAKGDKFKFRDINTLEEKEILISGVIDDNFHAYMYTGNKNLSEMLDIEEGFYNIIVSDKELDIKDEFIVSKTNVKMSQGQVEQLLSAAMVGVYAMFLVGFLLSVFVLYLIIDMTISEKRASISLLKILGFKKGEICSMIIDSELILVIIGFILGVPSGIGFSSHMFRGAVAKYGMSFELVVNPATILVSLAVILAAYFISTMILRHRAFHTDMVESLKNFRNE